MAKLIYGKNSVLDAIENELPIQKVYLTKPLNRKLDAKIEVIIKTKHDLNLLVTGNHQGFVAELRAFNYFNFATILEERPTKILILDHLQDPNNFGAIMRSANAAGVNHIIIAKNRQVDVTPAVLKVASGGYAKMKIIRVNSLNDAVIKLKAARFWIYCAALQNATAFKKVTFQKPMVLIVGNEAKGVSQSLLKLADQNIYIPMKGTVQSLNVAVATGILLFNE